MPESSPTPEAGFLQRWSRLKRETGPNQPDKGAYACGPEPAGAAVTLNRADPDRGGRVAAGPEGIMPVPGDTLDEVPVEAEKAFAELTDADMPPLESLGAGSDYRPFMAPGISAGLRNQALRRLFSQPHFNTLDGLDDYAGDYTTFEPLGAIVTADMKQHLRRQAQAGLKRLLDGHDTSLQQLADARTRALEALQQRPQAIAGSIAYQSAGRVLVIGGQRALETAVRLQAPLSPQVLLTDAPASALALPASRLKQALVPLAGRRMQVRGHLGAFEVLLEAEEAAAASTVLQADLVLDLQLQPALVRGILPPGYFAPGPEALEATLDTLAQLTGQFSKPRYFHYDPQCCVHGSSGIRGCTRCIDACPAEAIISVGEKIEVNPALCQGGGACATACPSGAIRYDYPTPSHTVDSLRILLRHYRDAGGVVPKILFHRAGHAPQPEALAPNVLPFALEELAAAGPELWFAALAFGAAQVLLWDEDATPEQAHRTLQQQLAIARTLLTGLGYPPEAILHLEPGIPASGIDPGPVMPAITPATQAGMADKRQQWLLALDHLFGQAAIPAGEISLPDGAPFGVLTVSQERCTLCMACATVCPLQALSGGVDRPRLRFNGAACVQCGLCASACPEQAIRLQPLYLADPVQRRTLRVLHEEEPFCCVSCGKPFGSRRMIDNLQHKLAGHAMFQSERARRRLQMCEDCRVVDVVQDPQAMADFS